MPIMSAKPTSLSGRLVAGPSATTANPAVPRGPVTGGHQHAHARRGEELDVAEVDDDRRRVSSRGRRRSLASSWGEVSMSITPDTEITTVRPVQSSLMTQPALAVATALLAKIVDSYSHLTGERAERVEFPARLPFEPGKSTMRVRRSSCDANHVETFERDFFRLAQCRTERERGFPGIGSRYHAEWRKGPR